MALTKAQKALRKRAANVGLPLTSSLEEIEVKEMLRKRAKAVGLPVNASIEEIELAEQEPADSGSKPEKHTTPKSEAKEKGFKGGFKKVKATVEEVMAYQEQGILKGWDPRIGIATIKEAPAVGFKYHQPAE